MDEYLISVFAWGGVCKGVTLQGLEYPLTGATLTPAFPLGVSNAFYADEARISVRDGMLLVIASRERRNDSR